MVSLGKISEEQIRDCASSAVFQRGKDYFKEGCVRDAILVSPTKIEGHIQGNQLYKTRVRIEDGELQCECSCPFDWEDFCKHAIALLLFWNQQKSRVPKLDAIRGSLMKKSKEELAELLLKTARNDPKMLRKVSQNRNQPISLPAHQRRVNQLFNRKSFWDWNELDELAGALNEMMEEGQEYLKQGDAKSALACFEAITYGIVENVNDTNTEGQLEDVFSDAADNMMDAFNQANLLEKESKKKLEKWIKTAKEGEYGFEDYLFEAMLKRLDSKRLPAVEQITRDILNPKENTTQEDSKKDALANFLLDLNLKQGNETEFIRNAEAHFESAHEKLVDYYLENRKFTQAILTAQKALALAKGFEISDLKEKIAKAQKALGKTADAFDSLLDAFTQDWDLAKYEEMKSLALRDWPKKRILILERIENAGEREVLAQVLASDEDISGLEKLLSRLRKDDDTELRIVEKALRRKSPASAAKALRLLALHSLKWTDRTGYRMAADYFIRAKNLLDKNGLKKERMNLDQLVQRIKVMNQRKPALQDEFKKI